MLSLRRIHSALLVCPRPSSDSCALAQRGAAFVELVISMLTVLLVVFGIIQFGIVLHEANTIVEASRHGARAAGARSGQNVPVSLTNGYLDATTSPLEVSCETAVEIEDIEAESNPILYAAIVGSCDFIEAAKLKPNEWKVAVSISQLSLGENNGTNVKVDVRSIKVIISPYMNRGPETWLRDTFGMQPKGESAFFAEVLMNT